MAFFPRAAVLNDAGRRAWRVLRRAALPALAALVTFGGGGAGAAEFRASDGARLHYAAAGAGETIVLVPGWTMPASIWAPQIEHLSRRYRVIAFDPRAQGASAVAARGYSMARRARDIGELIEHLGVPRVVLAGWSLGVLEALAYVRTEGDARVAALVLVDNSVGEDPPPASRSGNFFERLRREREKTMAAFVREMFRSAQTPEYLDALTAQALKTPLAASIELLTIRQPREYWREAVYGTARPVLYAVTPRFRGQAENLQRKRAGTRSEVFENAGHALFVDEPARFNALLDEFLAGVLH